MSKAVYCGECGFATQVSDNNRIPTRMEHTDSCSRRHIKSSIAYAMAFGIPVPVEIDDAPPRGLTINEWRRASGLTEYPDSRFDVNKLRANSGWLYVDQPICGCGVDVNDISIENTVTSYTQDDSTKTVICMQWHRLCYVNALV